MISTYIFWYRLGQKPSYCYFCRRIQDKRLGYSAQNLPSNSKEEVVSDETPDSCSQRGDDRPHHDSLLDASDIDDPIRGEIDEGVNDHIAHGDNGDHCV